MKITADTNVLVRAVVQDDAQQAHAATRILTEAELVAVPLPVLCELAWVLQRSYDFSVADVANAMRTLLAIPEVQTDRAAAEAGLALLEAGGDFADGVIAFTGHHLGGDTFVSFDRKALGLLQSMHIKEKEPQ